MAAKYLPEAQIAEFLEAFKIFDEDKDGWITAEELGRAYASVRRGVSEAQIRQWMSEVNTNEDGKIDATEFLNLMANTKLDCHLEVLESTFYQFDEDKDGYLDADELRQVVKALEMRVDVDYMMQRGDIYHDDKVSFEEFARIIYKGN